MSEKPDFPPEHKKRMYQGILLWLLVIASMGAWLWHTGPDTLEEYDSRIPYAQTLLKNVYLTEQGAADTDNPFSGNADSGGKIAHIALVMTGLGQSEKASSRAIHSLPDEVALAFSPYGTNISEWIKQSTRRKHETLVMLPMEPRSYPQNDPGPLSLLTRASEEENAVALSAALKDTRGASGVVNFMGSHFLSDVNNLAPVFRALNRRNMFFLEHREDAETLAPVVAQETQTPFLASDVTIDAVATETEIGRQLLALERIARKQGHAIGVMQPYPVTFNMVQSWLETNSRRDVRLVPLSFISKTKAMNEQQQKQ